VSNAPALVLRDVAVTYAASARGAQPVKALRGVSLTVAAGQVLGLAGPNGAGKTSLIELCVGALRPTSGAVEWFGRARLEARAKDQIGFCPDVALLPATLRTSEAISVFAALSGLTMAAVSRRVSYLVERLDLADSLSRRIGTLSRGTVQRLSIACALVPSPALVLCDESFAPLDPVAQVALRSLLHDEAARGAAVLVSSHQLDQLGRLADEIVVLNAGRVARYAGPRVLEAKNCVVLGVEALDADGAVALQTAFPGSWMAGDVLRVPWVADDRPTVETLFGRLPHNARGAQLLRVEEFSLEQMFLDALASHEGDS